MKRIIRIIAIFLLLMSFPLFAEAKESYNLDTVIGKTALYIYKNVSEPDVGSVGGEWSVFGLARSNVEVPDEYYSNYYERVEEYVKNKKGVLHTKKYTEYSRLIIALTAIGKDPRNVAGYNLLTPLGDYEKTIWQGLNGPIFALIALDSKDYEMPKNTSAKIQATREMYVDRILSCQLPDGGWSLLGGTASATSADNASDPDITGMALQALSKYRDNPKVKTAIDKALAAMSKKQDAKGGFSSWGTANSESCVQMLVALCELGISFNDARFVKNGNTILDSLMTYYNSDGSFSHTMESGSNLMATEQCFYGLVSVKRMQGGNNSLYSMVDAKTVGEGTGNVTGLKNKHADVKKTTVSNVGKTFSDIGSHKYKTAIEALSARGIINGKTPSTFEPEEKMTRAEFATIVVRSLGLSQKKTSCFKDVSEKDWFYGFVSCAYHYGIIKGVSQTQFNPNGLITREEAAVMVSRAGELCGMDSNISKSEIRNILCVFSDYVKASDWAHESLAFCYKNGVLGDQADKINPKEAVTRGEIANMLYNMLLKAKLL